MSAVISSEAIRARFDAGPMSATQKIAVALTLALSALDGYDVLSITFAAPAIAQAWGVGKAALGLILSSGLVGMALGSFLLVPVADVVGRRRMILVSVALMGTGALLSGFAHSLPQLATWRVLTGLGIGTCVAVINPISAEFANARWRPLSVALMAVGYPAGGVLGGVLAALLLKAYGWPAGFFAGFALALMLLPVVAWLLPESLAFLLNDPRAKSLVRLNILLQRCGYPQLESMPVRAVELRRGYAAIFQPGQLGTTVRVVFVNGLNASIVYYVLSWLPQMVVDAGFNPSKASLVAVVLNLVGIASGVIIGFLARVGGLRRWTVLMIIGFGLSTAAFGSTPSSLALLMLVAGILGFFLFASVAGFYAILADSFTDPARASGVGFVIGVGRVSSAFAPSLAGWLFAAGLGRAEVSAAFGACAIGAAIILATLPNQA
jgi:AAHS family 4-hydroxybenzoate transporter-like MFS transporter